MMAIHFRGLCDLCGEYFFADALALPGRCVLVGVELLDEAIALPCFRHPRCAAYVLGPERGYLTDALRRRCEFVIKIPARSRRSSAADDVRTHDETVSGL